MREGLSGRIARLALDRESGASEILEEAIAIFREALAAGVPVEPVARAVCRAQPSMASVWNLALEMLAPDRAPEQLEDFARRAVRGSAALGRFGREVFLTDTGRPLRLVTISFSRSVATLIEAIAASRDVRVSCSESRPALEGRRLASRLVSAGVAVTCFADAAIGQSLGTAEAVVVGADAVAPEWFLNKSGTRDSRHGGPAGSSGLRRGHARQVRQSCRVGQAGGPRGRRVRDLGAGAPGVTVRNPYFEPTPLELVSSLIINIGVIGSALAADVCAAVSRDESANLLGQL